MKELKEIKEEIFKDIREEVFKDSLDACKYPTKKEILKEELHGEDERIKKEYKDNE